MRSPRSCRKATRLVSDALERPLTRRERWSLRVHLLICSFCRRYRRQLRRLETLLAVGGEAPDGDVPPRLGAAARRRIVRALEEA